MAESFPPSGTTVLSGVIVEEHVFFSFTDLCRASGADAAQLQAMVGEGLIEPTSTSGHAGGNPDSWQFSGDALPRARTALRLVRDLELGLSGAVLVMDLLAEIESLRSRLRSHQHPRLHSRPGSDSRER